MKHTFNVLTRRDCAAGHENTELTIDWTGITEQELYKLAQNALVHDFQARMVKEKRALPEKYTIVAKQQVHEPPAALLKYCPKPAKPKIDKTLAAAFAGLTREELEILLSS